ncbi:cobalamin synthesis protein/P47K:Cobalamin synthesis protein-like protein/P47K [Saitoella complicata NRRL Y-17804]|uniref:CobW/HypB/UreG nucleotide-binding domain-containing protein n=1 Tax=Saitoella complicata (strain BCRC 22490 / CBS 7301 / JCM 7358 / NBRC 10748 / NRRL Y-17804) TaxID=698492 RepID=A0A0E9NEA0_SAICN|nr:cobalamin synthesis protein/P47K:Cobalamin synthesis protein-like protein/P47K [Saitoella complicata NRRL Y-17804]ODQ51466.1 cobalamin synthesis protein/P47K:Cobalamin synthesis protein-like protein/P47K [Saitoella complicata NRRL Y-17804]GAO48174.1 hypothetical protein G7K_2354-t1 [Saitoella complicata NRRL Y-17804]
MSVEQKRTPVNVFTGFLGSGKTTVILSLLKHLPKDYKICIVKNEFGDVKVDSELARNSNVTGVQEMLNGCMCCVLVGQMKNAILELRDQYNPDRIVIETSGSAFPATIAWQIRELKDQGIYLDSIVTVIDCVNFRGYEDTSPTAAMQAKYTDLILMNKHETVSERDYDTVLDHVYDLNPDTAKIKTFEEGRVGCSVPPDLVFGLDSKLFQLTEKHLLATPEESRHHHDNEVDIIQVFAPRQASPTLTHDSLSTFLTSLPKDDFYRVKGMLRLPSIPSDVCEASPINTYILNYAFGRWEFTPLENEPLEGGDQDVRLTAMLARGSARMGSWADKLGAAFGGEAKGVHVHKHY